MIAVASVIAVGTFAGTHLPLSHAKANSNDKGKAKNVIFMVPDGFPLPMQPITVGLRVKKPFWTPYWLVCTVPILQTLRSPIQPLPEQHLRPV